jgi:hypothetical protein
MRISEQAKTQIIRLIDEGQNLDPLDLREVDRWARASHEALKFDPVHQAKFDEYCCVPWGPASMRVCLGLWMLKQPLLAAEQRPQPRDGEAELCPCNPEEFVLFFR